MSQQQVPDRSQQYRQSDPGGEAEAFTTQQPPQQQQAPRQQQNQQAPRQQPQSQQQPQQQQQRTGEMAGPVGQRFPSRSYLPESVRTTSIGLLNRCLADLVTVTMQLKDAHWNVKGMQFYQLHGLFEDLVETLEPHADAIAERASALGGQALGTPHDVVQTSRIPQLPREAVDGQTLLDDMTYRLSLLDASIYRAIETATRQEDLDSADLLNEVSRDVSKALWFVEAHLQGPRGTGTVGGGRPPEATGQSGAGQGQTDTVQFEPR